MFIDKKRLLALEKIITELNKAEEKHPNWPTDPVHQAAILVAEASEAVQAAIDLYHKGEALDKLKLEAAQVGAMAFRILINLE